MLIFKDKIELSVKDYIGIITFEDATIEYDGINYIISASSKEGRRISLLSREWNDNPEIFSLSIVNPSEIKGSNCLYDLSDITLLRIKGETYQHGIRYQWAISSLKKVIQTNIDEPYMFHIVPVDKNCLLTDLKDIELNFEYKHNGYFLSLGEDKDIVIRTDKDNKYINMIISLLSIYYGTAMEIRCKEQSKDGRKTIVYLPVQYKFHGLSSFTNDLDYLKHVALSNLFQFLELSLKSVESYNLKKSDYIVKAIERYMVSKYMDNQTKFIYLTSILETFSEKVEEITKTEIKTKKDGKEVREKRNAYNMVSESLMKKNIDLDKLNNTINEDTGLSGNFVDLRNEILHNLPTEKIVNYLNYKYPIYYLEFAVCLVILHHIGFDNIHFREGFELSIYKE